MASPPAMTTTILVKNLHCVSCATYIRETLAAFRAAIAHTEISILTHEIRIHHGPDLSIKDVCLALDSAAFEIYSATTEDVTTQKTHDLVFMDGGDDWFETVTGKRRGVCVSKSSAQELLLPSKHTDMDHVAKCDACQINQGMLSADPAPLPADEDEEYIERVERGDAAINIVLSEKNEFVTLEEIPSSHGPTSIGTEALQETQYDSTLSIGGMTCASCSSAIDHALSELQFVMSVNVSLMTNSASVSFKGRENMQRIVDTVEDLGYDCTMDRLDQHNHIANTEHGEGPDQRKAIIEVSGMFCEHCPARIEEAIRSTYSSLVSIDKEPTLQHPVIEISYTPRSPDFTIRDIIRTIDSVSEYFSATMYSPPSIEQRSQAMQRLESRRILFRLIFSFVAGIPTFLFGVVLMSLVPKTNALRQFCERPMWAGNVSRSDWALFIVATLVYVYAANIFHIRSIKELRSLWRRGSRVPVLRRFYRFGSMNLLISAGTSVAYFSSIAILGINATTAAQQTGNTSTYFDSVVFLTFFILVGKWLEVYSKAKTGNAVAMLGNLRPQETLLARPAQSLPAQSMKLEETQEAAAQTPSWSLGKLDVSLLEVGDVVCVQHGSSPPADGVVIQGSTKFKESSLTGEARLVPKSTNDPVFAGAVNIGEPIYVKITNVNGTSMLDQIISVVREGQTKRAPVERLVDVVTGYFVPVITLLAILTWIIWLVLGESGTLSKKYLGSSSGGWAFWSLEFAIAVFVVACPCGIGLAAPTALFVGSGLAAEHGILVRGGGEAFQEASNVDIVVFDKTGTLTEGDNVQVTDHELFVVDGDEAAIVWAIIQSLEERSSHPLALAIHRFASARATDQQVRTVAMDEEPGKGLKGTFASPTETFEAALGSEGLIASLTPASTPLTYFASSTLSAWKSQSKSVALFAFRRIESASEACTSPWTVKAILATSDPIRPSSAPTLSALQSRGIPAYVLTGDNPTTAAAVASTISIPQDRVFAGVLPIEKAAKIKWLQENGPRRKGNEKRKQAIVAFVGDGVNDAPALTQANISISLSSASDVAVNSSSFVLLPPASLENVITLLDLSRRVFRRVMFNFGWAIVYNALLVPVAAGILFRVKEEGWRLGPVWGSAAMALSSLGVILSSLLLRWE